MLAPAKQRLVLTYRPSDGDRDRTALTDSLWASGLTAQTRFPPAPGAHLEGRIQLPGGDALPFSADVGFAMRPSGVLAGSVPGHMRLDFTSPMPPAYGALLARVGDNRKVAPPAPEAAKAAAPPINETAPGVPDAAEWGRAAVTRPMFGGVEPRSARRYAVKLDATYELMTGTLLERHQFGHTVEISATGCRLRSGQGGLRTERTGTRVFVHLRLPRGGERIRLVGAITWSTPPRDGQPGLLGVTFDRNEPLPSGYQDLLDGCAATDALRVRTGAFPALPR